MAEKEVFLTLGGLKKLEEELEYLKSVKRREVAERIKEAIGFGDLSENSEYEDAKNEQAFIEGRILALEKTLRHARVIDTQELPDNVVSLGSKVTVKDVDSGEEMTYEIVGSLEADPAEMKISVQSPVGKALLGREVGSLVEIQVPDGTLRYQILNVSK
ncbi:MAG: transcription elongation factor GreA [Thermanaeromonas sp.]|uniref:transcription elongation factor GreA n=1 Tax=Thermanaeromonas sp. TaxID=2003697 RepID=UPI002440E302|nr:transcription elongation factor GreA [Thermanaeromonas sp.]MCG0278360.1 transcription elongation factor GreA [Thermanaeromonas sp.]